MCKVVNDEQIAEIISEMFGEDEFTSEEKAALVFLVKMETSELDNAISDFYNGKASKS